MSLLLALLYVPPPVEPTKRGSGSETRRPKRQRFEVDTFSDFEVKPITIRKTDDEECLLLLMI